MPVNAPLCDLLTDLIISCHQTGEIVYANPAAQRWSDRPLREQRFTALPLFDDTQKGQKFFDAARLATPDQPTPPWELIIGTSDNYTIATFRGFYQDDQVIIVGNVETETVSKMQQELLDLTSELAESQREVRRQNRALHQSLADQRDLVRTIMRLTSPSVPIWDGALFLQLAGATSRPDFDRRVHELWHRSGDQSARYVILDMSNITGIDGSMVERVVAASHVLGNLGVQALLSDAGSGLAIALKQRGPNGAGLRLFSDVHQAVSYIGATTATAMSHHEGEA